MKYVVLDSFRADYQRLTDAQRALFKAALAVFVTASDRYADKPASPWPSSLRVRSVERAPGILEMTWSFSGPDGRATFEWTQLEGELAVRWRRIGSHRIFREP